MLNAYTLNDRIHAHSHNAAHAMEVPPSARLLFCNGQVGARLDGTVPDGARQQVEVIFERIARKESWPISDAYFVNPIFKKSIFDLQ